MPSGICLPPTLNVILSVSAGPTWPPPSCGKPTPASLLASKSLSTTTVRFPSPLSTAPSPPPPTSPSSRPLPTSSINPSRSVTTPGCPSDLPPLIYSLPSTVFPSRLTQKMTLPCATFSNPPYLTLSHSTFPKPASSTPIGTPDSTIKRPSRSWYRSPRKTVSSYPTFPESLSLVAVTSSRAYPSFPSKPCNNCWRFGHVKPRCKNPTVCPLCAGPHAKIEHRYPNPTCPKGGNLKPVLNRCIASPARCPNCSEDHSAGYRDCTARPVPPPRNAPGAPEAVASAPAAPRRPPQPAVHQPPSADPDAMDTQPDEARPPAPSSNPPPLGLESPLEFATPRAPLRPALMGPSGSTTRTGRPQPDGEPSPSPATRDQWASRR